nr:hypothetical protein [uncultured Treponema sp.]
MILFDARKITSYEDFESFLKKETDMFNSTKISLFEKYDMLKADLTESRIEEYQSFRNEYRELVQRIIKDVIAHYRHHLPKNCLITEFGSFIKRTERILSDIDITFCYDEEKTEIYECAEELIDFTIASILGFSIDHVHGNFQHYPKNEEFNKLTESDNHYRIQFDENVIDYKCGPETLAENLTNIKNIRDYKTLLTSFEIKYQKKADIDSLYSIEILENTTNHDLLLDLMKFDEKYDICDNYQFKLQDSYLNENFSISELKKILKHNGIVEFYIFIAKLRKSVELFNSYYMNIEMLWHNKPFIDFFGFDFVNRLRTSFITFIFYWNRIELSLKKRGIALSTRCYKSVTKKEINNILNNEWGYSTNIDTILTSKNNLTHMISEGLSKI